MKTFIPAICLMALLLPARLLLADAPASTELIDRAEAFRSEASTLGFEWRDTAQLIRQAREALGKNDRAESDRLAKQALLQGQQAVAQGKLMRQSWKSYIPK